MASNLRERQQRNNQMLVKPKHPPLVKQQQAADPWSFLEVVDAPQWVDLSLEPRSIGKNSAESWFVETHEHHVISLAGRNRSMSWVSPGKPCLDKQRNQSAISKCKGKGYHLVATKPEKKKSVGHHQVSDYSHSTKVKDVQSRKKTSYSNSSHRTSSTGFSSSVLHGLVDTVSTFSSSSSICEYEPGKSPREHSLGSDLQSVTSSSQAFPIKSKSLVNVRRGTSKQVEDPYGTPMRCAIGGQRSTKSSSASNSTHLPKSSYSLESGGSTPMRCAIDGQRGRNSSSASTSIHLPKSSYSLESGSSTCTTLTSYERGVSTFGQSRDLDVSQPACHDDHQFPGEPVSEASCLSQEAVITVCVRSREVASPNQKVRKLDDVINCNQPYKTVDPGLSGSQWYAKATVKRGLKVGTQRFEELRASQIGLLPRKQLHSGKENAPPNKNLRAVNSLQAKDFASSKIANASCDIKKGNIGRCVLAPQISLKAGCVQSATFKGGVLPVKASSCAQQRKKAGAKQVPVLGCTSNETRECERDLAALVAQHNLKVRTLKLQGCWKGLR